MSASPSRRLIAGTAVSGLLLGGLALVGSAQAAGICPLYTDPAGDTPYVASQPTPEDGQPLTNNDPDVDILDVSHSVEAGVFTTTIHLKGLLDTGPLAWFADRFESSFTVNAKAATIQVDRDYTGVPARPAVKTATLLLGTTKTTVKVTLVEDFKASTLTTKIAAADVETALGGGLAGKPFSAMTSTAGALYTAGGQAGYKAQDTATATATAVYAFGQSCAGGGAPAPAPTATPTEEPEEGEEEPEEEPSATPSPTTSEEPEEGEEEPEEPAAPVLFEQPRAGCVAFKDAAGDAKPGRSPLFSPNNDADLDLTEVSVKSGPEALAVYAKVATLGAAPATAIFNGHKFTAAFSFGGKAISVSADKAGPAVVTVDTKANTDLKATAVFDTKASNVVFSLPNDGLATVLGAPLKAAAPLTNLTLTTNATNPGGSFDGDTATGAKPEEKTYAYGDNTCFQPPVGKLSLTGATSGVFTDKATVTATLLDTADAAVEGAKVSLTLTGMTVLEGTTDEDGAVVFTFPITVPAGAKKVTAAFLGTDTVGPVALASPFTVKAEKALLKVVAGRGTMTATLADDDRTVLAGQVVVFTVGSKVTKVKTNAKGVAVLTRQTKGATVKVSFVAIKDQYTAAPTVSAKVL